MIIANFAEECNLLGGRISYGLKMINNMSILIKIPTITYNRPMWLQAL